MASNINSEEIDSETKEKLKGDLIGDTMYSESFIVRTLLRFNDNDWNEDFEDDLCFLWDMTTERVVCDYLFRLSFPALVRDVLVTEPDNRLVEILIGTLGNMYVLETAPRLKPPEIAAVLKYLETDDHLILVQIMRFIKAISYHTKDKLDFVTPDVLTKMTFVLSNSLNVELLDNTLDALVKVTDGPKLDAACLTVDMIKPCLDAFQTICESEKYEDINVYTLKSVRTSTNYWVQVLLNLTVYVQSTSNTELLDNIARHSEKILDEFANVLSGYQDDNELKFFADDLVFLVETIGFICPVYRYKCEPVFYALLGTFCQLIDDNEVDPGLGNAFVDVLCYFLSVITVQSYSSNLKPSYCKGLNYIKNCHCTSEHKYIDNLNVMINLHNTITNSK